MPTSPLTVYLRLQKALDQDVIRSLIAADASITAEMKRLATRVGIGNQVRLDQAVRSRIAVQRALSAHWSRVGDLTAASQAEAAASAAEGILAGSSALASVFPKDDRDYMIRSARASAARSVDVAMERIGGSSYIPLAQSVYDNNALSSGKIDEIVNSAIARGASAAELARDVRAFVNPNTPGGVRYASMRLARSELNNAFHASQVREAIETPWVLALRWNLSGSHPVPDECNLYAERSHYPGGEAGMWLPEEVPAKPHPNCLCFTTPEDVGEEEFLKAFHSGAYDDHLNEKFPDLKTQSLEVPQPTEKITPRRPINKVGSDALRDQLRVAESQRQSLWSDRYVKGSLNAEKGYTRVADDARKDYTGSGYLDMNLLKRDPAGFLEEWPGDDDWLDRIAKQNDDMESLFEHNALQQDSTVARFMTGDFKHLEEGDFFSDPGFLSTTTDMDTFLAAPSQEFRQGLDAGQDQWTFVIQADKGTPAIPGAEYQKEIIFQPGIKQRILSVDQETRTVYTEIVKKEK